MNYDGKVVIGTEIDSKSAERDLDKIKKSTQGIGSETDKVTKKQEKYKKTTEETTKSVGAMGKAIAAAFAVKILIDFGKKAIQVASDLQEVQNVVDTAFGTMAEQANKFAETSIEAFGLSELTAKKTASTFMAMASGMGLVGQSAVDMSLNLTGLTGDLASFFNVRQDVAETALASIFTGETESLKKFGIVMTEANLQQFAYKEGVNELVSGMTEAEKVQLRYNFVLDRTKLAQGDFAKTSDSWANQTRILTEKFKEFMGAIGEDLIAILNPLLSIFVAMLDTFSKMATALSSLLADSFQPFGDWCQKNKAAVQVMADAIIGFLIGLYSYIVVKELPALIYKLVLSLLAMNTQAVILSVTFGLLGAAIILIANNWDKMSNAEKVVAILGAITIAAVAAAVAIGALQSATSYGIAAAAIVAGVAAIGISISLASARAQAQAKMQASSIPKFARGGVFHGGDPILGVLNDQPRGQTNIETPLATMQEAFKSSIMELGGVGGGNGVQTVNIRFNGTLSELARVLKPEIDIETNRIGNKLVGGMA